MRKFLRIAIAGVPILAPIASASDPVVVGQAPTKTVAAETWYLPEIVSAVEAPAPRCEITPVDHECLQWWLPLDCPPGAIPGRVDGMPAPPREPAAPQIPKSNEPDFSAVTPTPAAEMARPNAAIASLSAGQGALVASNFVPMMTGDLFGSGTSTFVVDPGSHISRGPALINSFRFFTDRNANGVLTQPPDTGLNIATSTSPQGLRVVYTGSNARFPTPVTFETVQDVDSANAAFADNGQTQFALRDAPSLRTDSETFLNGRPEYAPGQAYGGGVIAPTGPDFDSVIRSLQAAYDVAGSATTPGVNEEPSPDTDYFFVNTQIASAPLVQFDPSPTIMNSLPGGSIAAAPGASVGRVKLAENTSPIPRDRLFMNYSYFSQTPLTPGGLDVNRVTPGFEKTMLDGNASFELRAPFATTLSSTLDSAGMTNTNQVELGNMSMFLKALLWHNDVWGVSTGCGMSLPTANDFKVQDSVTGNTILKVTNESVHVLPFIGALYAPDDRLFAQGLVQFDLDPSGNPVSLSSYAQGRPTGDLSRIGRPNDADYVYIGANAGYWIYQGSGMGPVSGLAPFAEVHYNQTLDVGDRVAGTVEGATFNSGRAPDLQLVNAVVGINASIKYGGLLTVAYATPVGGGNDQQYNSEIRVIFNILFGPQSRFTRAQF
jgi:hypothetical protein